MMYVYKKTSRGLYRKRESQIDDLEYAARHWRTERVLYAKSKSSPNPDDIFFESALGNPWWTITSTPEVYYEDSETGEFIQVFPYLYTLPQKEIIKIKLLATVE